MDLDLRDKVAVITGAGRGIGLATAKLMAAEGAKIGIIDVNAESASKSASDLAQKFGIKSVGVGANIASHDDVIRARDELSGQLGAADILVNCAAIADEKLFLDSGPEDWDRVISVCLFGALNCLHTFVPEMTKRGRGRIICLASDSARIGQARLSYYAAAKAGVIALCKSVAQEVGRTGVTINVISPGATNTEMRRERETRLAVEMGPEKYERRTKSVLKFYPTGRVGEPDDIASAILFLASDRSSWITGQVLSVNGGFTMP
jgi:NAD(P)-dependent dehydrogenase (short-subunit alcohol dehydrogenase family)